jgi:hypothetical protein
MTDAFRTSDARGSQKRRGLRTLRTIEYHRNPAFVEVKEGGTPRRVKR